MHIITHLTFVYVHVYVFPFEIQLSSRVPITLVGSTPPHLILVRRPNLDFQGHMWVFFLYSVRSDKIKKKCTTSPK